MINGRRSIVSVFYTWILVLVLTSYQSLGSEEVKPEFESISKNENYELIRESLQKKNYTLAEQLIKNESISKLGDPELEYYQVDLWLRKANELYGKEQYKSALDYYYKVYQHWPNHATVRERIDYWKDKEPFNKKFPKVVPSEKSLNNKEKIAEPEEKEKNTETLSLELYLLSEKIASNNQKMDHLLATLHVFVGIAIAIFILLFMILLKFIMVKRETK
jgi:hypothetical protein